MRTTSLVLSALVALASSGGCVSMLQPAAKAPPIGVKQLHAGTLPVTTAPDAIRVIDGRSELPRGFFYVSDRGGPGGGPRFKLYAVPDYPTREQPHVIIAGMAPDPPVAVWGRQADALRAEYRKRASELGANALFETGDSNVAYAIIVGAGTPAGDDAPAAALIEARRGEVKGYKPLGKPASLSLASAEWDLATKEARCYAAIIAFEPGAELSDDAQAALYLELESADGLLGNRSYGGPKEAIADSDGFAIEAPTHGRFVAMRSHAAELGCAKGSTTARLRLWTRGKVTNIGRGTLQVAMFERSISKKELAEKVREYELAMERAAIEAERQRAEDARREAERDRELARREREQAERDRLAARQGGGGGGGGGGGSSYFSLTLKNECPRTVKLFIGDKPKWGSGTSTSIGSNTITSYSGTAPQMYWIVDDGENGLSSYTASPGSQRVRILPSCTGFAPD